VRNLSWVSLREASSASALRECSPYAELLPPRENPRTDAQKQRVGHPRKPKKRQREQLLVEITRKKKEEQNQDSARSIEGVPQSQGNPGGNVLFWAAPSPGTAMRWCLRSHRDWDLARRREKNRPQGRPPQKSGTLRGIRSLNLHR
jgi:hypothetical protein